VSKKAILFAAILLIASVSGRSDPSTGRIRVIMLGEINSGNVHFVQWIGDSPKFVLTRIACDINVAGSVSEGKRLVRVYMPRTEERLVNHYDVAIFEDFTPEVMRIEYLDWFQNSVAKGMGIALIEFVNWLGTNEIQIWMTLRFYELFPADVYMNNVEAILGRTYYRVLNEAGPLNLPGIEDVPMNSGHHGDMGPRSGSTVEAVWRGRGTPAMVTSSYGQGSTLQLAHGWDNIPTRDYRYMLDYIFNTVFCIAGEPYPDDLDLVHAIREQLVSYRQRRRATLAVLEFVEKFGANPSGAEQSLAIMEDSYAQASQHYIEADYEMAADILKDLAEGFPAIDEELMRTKDRALEWIYLIEWSAVSGVALICGSALWLLMVRGKLYHEVTATRMR